MSMDERQWAPEDGMPMSVSRLLSVLVGVSLWLHALPIPFARAGDLLIRNARLIDGAERGHARASPS